MRSFGDASTTSKLSSNREKLADLLGWNCRRFRYRSDPTAQPDRRVGRAAAGQEHDSSSFAALSISRASLRRSRWSRLPGQACIPKARPSPPRTLPAGARQRVLDPLRSHRCADFEPARKGLSKANQASLAAYQFLCCWHCKTSCKSAICLPAS